MRHPHGIAQRHGNANADKQLHSVGRTRVLGMGQKGELRLERQRQSMESLGGQIGN